MTHPSSLLILRSLSAALLVLSTATSLPGQVSWPGNVQGPSPNYYFGWALCATSDFDGDGVHDLFVGAPGVGYSPPSSGKVYLVSGGTGAILVEIPGPASYGHFGVAVCDMGDLNGDGYPEVAIGEPNYSGVAINAGRVLVYSGMSIHLAINAPQTTLQAVEVPSFGTLSGTSLASADFDGDGISDLAIGASEQSRIGFVSGASIAQNMPSGQVPPPPPFQLSGNAGAALATMPDVDSDGRPELVVGAPTDSVSNPFGHLNEGSVSVISGASLIGTTLVVIQQKTGLPGDFLGSSVACVGDLDLDGQPDVAAGAFDNSVAAGYVRVWSAVTSAGPWPIVAELTPPVNGPTWAFLPDNWPVGLASQITVNQGITSVQVSATPSVPSGIYSATLGCTASCNNSLFSLSVPVTVTVVPSGSGCGTATPPSWSPTIAPGTNVSQTFSLGGTTLNGTNWVFYEDSWPPSLSQSMMANGTASVTVGATAPSGVYTGSIVWLGACDGVATSVTIPVSITVAEPCSVVAGPPSWSPQVGAGGASVSQTFSLNGGSLTGGAWTLVGNGWPPGLTAQTTSSGAATINAAPNTPTGTFTGTLVWSGPCGAGLASVVIPVQVTVAGQSCAGVAPYTWNPIVTAGTSATQTFTLTGPNFNNTFANASAHNFGVSIVALGDLDGDGYPDLAIGAATPPNPSVTPLDNGTIEVISGEWAVHTHSHMPPSSPRTLLVNNGASFGDALGLTILAIPDVNGDGLRDFAYASPGSGSPPSGNVGLQLTTLAFASPVQSGCGSVAPPVLNAIPPRIGHDLVLSITDGPPNRGGVLFMTPSSQTPVVPIGGNCSYVLDPNNYTVGLYITTDALGQWNQLVSLAGVSPSLLGQWFTIQAAFAGTASAIQVDISTGQRLRVGH